MTSRVERNSVWRWAGLPVPWFVAWIDGKPDFRVVDTARMMKAHRLKLCMLCGDALGVHVSFVIGPMCCINRVSSERDCCEYAVKACPFLSDPEKGRRDDNLPDHRSAAGFGVKRNPGVTAIWTTRSSTRFVAGRGNRGFLWKLGEPESVTWWCRGREATRKEVRASLRSGLPSLVDLAVAEGNDAVRALVHACAMALPLLPVDKAELAAA
jgi:hypothetical protein